MPTTMLFALALTAAAGAAAAYLLTALSGIDDDPPGGEGARLRALREASATYRWFEPTVRVVARLYLRAAPASAARLAHKMEVLDVPHWRADELAGAKHVEAALMGAAAGCGAAMLAGPAAGVVVGAFIALLFPMLLLKSYITRADEHVRLVRSRLPYAMDLMALMLEAGAGTLRECLERAGKEHAGQPLGAEFQRLLFGVEKGVKMTEMLRAMDRRLADEDVKDLVLTVTTSEERGISLREALRGLADRMRQRRVQWMEKSAEQAKVKITGPAMVTMLGCLLIVVAPILLHAFGTAK